MLQRPKDGNTQQHGHDYNIAILNVNRYVVCKDFTALLVSSLEKCKESRIGDLRRVGRI